ncbi:MAG: hypothetical protein J7L79_02695 [Thaumarchaeota archaeon]|nr:hypothetical protein [Nitrososphaerota archaeon]
MSAYHEVKLTCRLPPGSCEPEERLVEALRSAGYIVEGNRILGASLEAELKGASLLGDELMFLVRRADPRALSELVNVLSRKCWYIDVYYHLRGKEALKAAGNLGLRLDESGEEAEVREQKVHGISLKINLYPRLAALTISYRVGWSEANRSVVMKVHERVFGGMHGAGLLRRLLRWAR